MCPLASAALRQARAGTRGAAPATDTDTPVPATGPTSTSNELAAMAAANIRDGDPVSRRKAAKYREEQQKKAGKEAVDKENAARALEEKENKRKRLEVLQTAASGITNIATSLAKMAELKEAEQQAGKRQKKIEALKLKLTLGLGDENKNRQALEELLDEE